MLVASTAGEAVDNRTRVDVVQQQEILIREEEREKMERDREKLEKEMEVSDLVLFVDWTLLVSRIYYPKFL